MKSRRLSRAAAASIICTLFILAVCAVALLFLHRQGEINPDVRVEYQPNESYSRTLRVAADYDYDPYTFLDEDLTPSGHDVELIYILADRMGYNVELSLMPWSEALASIQNGNADLVLTVAYSPVDSSGLMLSAPLVNDPFVAFGTAPYTQIGELYGKHLAVLEGTGCIAGFIEPYRLSGNTTEYASISEVFAAVQSGACDYAIVRYSVGRRAMAALADSDIQAVGPTLLNNYVCIGMHPDQTVLLEELDRAIISMTSDGTLTALSEKWLGSYVETLSLKDLLKNNIDTLIYISGALALLFLVLLFLIGSSITRKKEHVLKRLAERDQLTGLYNRAACENIIREVLNASDPEHDVYALFVIDMDNFKAINDTFGHMEGDATLSMLASGLSRVFCAEDIVGRLGGDEFFVFMANCKDAQAPERKAKEIGSLFSNTYRLNEITLTVSASVGIALYPKQGTSFAQLYKSADDPLYEAKRCGKSGYAYRLDGQDYVFNAFETNKARETSAGANAT